MVLCLTPTLLIIGAMALVEVGSVFVAFGQTALEVRRGRFWNVPSLLIIYGQAFFWIWMYFPPRCPACRRFALRRLTGRLDGRVKEWTDAYECRGCGARSSRVMTWLRRGRMKLDDGAGARSDVLSHETHDS
jgi:hypothetical protein